MIFYKLTRGTMDEHKDDLQPAHIRFGFGFLHVDGVMVCDYQSAGLKKLDLQRSVHAYSQATGRKFSTATTIDGDALIVKRTA